LDGEPLISRGGRTTPGGAFISSSTAMASPFAADGAMLGCFLDPQTLQS
jgi:hypothetical protein